MPKIIKRIEIVRSNVKGLSSMSQLSCDAIYKVLADNYSHVGVTIINNESDLEKLDHLNADLVFLGMENVPRKGHSPKSDQLVWITDYLDNLGIAYTGSNKHAHSLGRDKSEAKRRMQESGVATAKYCVVLQGQQLSEEDLTLSYPIFIKPGDGGGGYGVDSMSLVHNFDQLCAKVTQISSELGCDSLIEEYLPGREFSVAILKSADSGLLEALPIELVAPEDENGTRMLSQAVKGADAEVVSTVYDHGIKFAVSELALDAFMALGARDYGRIDIRLDKDGTPHFLEANLIPSLIDGYGSFPKACALNRGLTYVDMIISIAGLGLLRANNDMVDLPHRLPVHQAVLSS